MRAKRVIGVESILPETTLLQKRQKCCVHRLRRAKTSGDMKTTHLTSLLALALALFVSASRAAVTFDFHRAEDCQGWHAAHDVSSVRHTADGLEITISGDDPYVNGPARDYPAGQPLWMTLRLRSEQEGMAQVFFFDRAPTEERSVRFPVEAGKWQQVRIPLPPLGPRYHLRFDPPGTAGRAVLASAVFEPRIALTEPRWAAALPGSSESDWIAVRSGELTLLHGKTLGEFVVQVANTNFGLGSLGGQIGYVAGGAQRWIALSNATVRTTAEPDGVIANATLRDRDGATWTFKQHFRAVAGESAIRVTTTVSVDQARDVAFIPMLTLFPGAGSFGRSKTQALFPGLDYLDRDEPSSSEADIVGAGSRRQVPDTVKVTIPMMSIVADGRYLAMAWQPDRSIAPVFDSPDRFFNSGGHVMGLIYPGSTGNDRVEGSLLPHGSIMLRAGEEVKAVASIAGGRGSNCVRSVEQFVRMNGLPALPKLQLDLQGYVRLAAAGWLNSEIREGSRFRHAWPGEFRPQPAADAAWMMDWLAVATRDATLAVTLTNTAAAALREVPPHSYNASGVSHVRYPVAPLLYGHVGENVRHARQIGRSMLQRFQPDGSVLYQPGKVDYGKTHFSREANGLTAQAVASLLEQASICGDDKLVGEGLRLLRAMDKFTGTVPRGAQTWECPLHTPDILASAHLVKAYVIGYELSGDEHLLATARYWAWTGVPFVYLTNPAGRDVGPYATIAVYGATSWVAPNWMGLPVQWCGLVYADALYRLGKYTSQGPWKQLADGIVISGIQQTFPADSPTRKGLLPDSYVLRAGVRQNPAINPGTVQAPAMHYFGRPIYDFAACRNSGVLVHAPGRISDVLDEKESVRFHVSTGIGRGRVLLARCRARPVVAVNGQESEVDWQTEQSIAVVDISGDATVRVAFP
jgi:hypothetical protein